MDNEYVIGKKITVRGKLSFQVFAEVGTSI